MKRMKTNIDRYGIGACMVCALSLAACIDEDLSDCPTGVEMRDITVSYQIDLQHGVDPEFDDALHSLHLGFWNTPQSLYYDKMLRRTCRKTSILRSPFLWAITTISRWPIIIMTW